MFAMHEQTGCGAVMIGRDAIGNPWIFDELRAKMTGMEFTPPNAPASHKLLLLNLLS